MCPSSIKKFPDFAEKIHVNIFTKVIYKILRFYFALDLGRCKVESLLATRDPPLIVQHFSTASNIYLYTQIHSNILKYTQIHSNTPKYTQIYSNILKYTQIHSNTRK